jgi:hypothetical protein
MLAYYSFERKTRKCWKKLFFHLFDLVVVNAHILHNKTSKKMSLEIFYEKVAEGLFTSAGTDIQVQGQTSSPAGRLVGRDHFLLGFQQHVVRWRELLSAHVTYMRREASARLGKL